MDKFYNQFFNSNEYPPDKKERPQSTGSDELDSTVDDRTSHVGPSKYDDLQTLDLGPPLDGDRKGAPEAPLSPTPQYHSQKQMKAALPRETYIRADAGDAFIKPRRMEPDADVWPPNYDEAPIVDIDAGNEERYADEKKPRYPRITYNPADADEKRPPRRRPGSPPPPHRRRPGSPPPPQRRPDTRPPPNRRRAGSHSPPPPHRRPGPPPRRPDERRPMPPHSDRFDEKRSMSPQRYDEKRPMPPHSGRFDEKRPRGPQDGPPGRRPGGPPGGPPGGRRARLQGVISPYIGKWAQLSRVWSNQTVILIVFMGIGYMMMADGARRMAIDTAAGLLAACAAIDTAADNVVNAPSHAALSMLGVIESSVMNILRATEKTLVMVINTFRDIIIWVIKIYVGTYICFAELIIRTALSMITEASKLLTDALNKALDAVMPTLQNVAANIASGIQDAGNKIIGAFTGGDNSKKIDFHPDDIRKQLDVQIPTDWINSISSLQDKIPTEASLTGNATALLDIPFSYIRTALTAAFAGVHVDFISGVNLPTDKRADVCSAPMGQDTIIALGDAAAKIMFLGGLLMIGAAVALIAYNLYMELRGQRRFQTRLVEFRHELIDYTPPRSVREIEEKPATRREMDMFVLPGNKWLDRFTKMLIRKFGDNERTSAWRWWLHYVWHPPAIACFVAGAIGLMSIFGQIYAINGLRRQYVPMLARELVEFQGTLSTKIITPVHGDSVALAGSINGNIVGKEGELNHTLFGPVSEGTGKVNDTLNGFVKTYIDGIRSVFGGTPLQTPIEGLVNCTLTKNIQSIQLILGFINEFASGVHLPRISEDVLLRPLERLIGPLNATATNFREYAVGYYIPNADELDPNSFPEVDYDSVIASYEAKLSVQATAAKDTPSASPPSSSSSQESIVAVSG
ncbi:plasma membrane fusion protein prm1, partial [Coemansia spiralis]